MEDKNILRLADLKDYIIKAFSLLLKNINFILLAGACSGIIGFFYAKNQKPIYISKYTFILNENEGNGTINLSSLAGIAGLSGIGGSSNNVNEDKLLYIANSRQIIGSSLLKKYVINNKTAFLINHFIDIYNLQNGFKNDTSLINFNYFKNDRLPLLTYQENKVLDLIIKKINAEKFLTIDTKKKTGIVIQSAGIIAMDFKSINEEFSKYFLESLYDNLSNYYILKTSQRQFKNYLLIKERADSIKSLLTEKEDLGANIFDNNIKVVKMKGRVDLERNRRDIQLLSLMYGEVLKNLEIAKFNLDNQTPFFQTVDNPTFPLEIKKKSKLIFSIIFSVIGTIIFNIYLLYKNRKILLRS
jgi:hypothetical protein